MRAGLYQTKNGLFGLLGIVAIQEVNEVAGDFLVHGLRALQSERAFILAHLVLGGAIRGLHPEHRPRWGQAHAVLRIDGARSFRDAGDGHHLHRRRDALLGRTLVDVEEAHLLHGVQVVEVTPVLLEAVRGGQGIRVIAQVVLAELAGVVAEVQQELGQARSPGFQIGRAAGQLRRDQARAQRIHACDEGIAAGRAALHGDVVHEDRALAPDTVNIGRFADHQAAVIDARLHPADVITHDEEDVGFLCLLPGRGWRGLRVCGLYGPACAYQRSRCRKQQ